VRDELGPQALWIVESWGLPKQVTRETPAASVGEAGWDGFNVGDNQGEVLGARKDGGRKDWKAKL
jgi:hypothetical protein